MGAEAPDISVLPDGTDAESGTGHGVLLPVFDECSGRGTRTLAAALSRSWSAELVFLTPVTVPNQTPLELPDRYLSEHRRVASEAVRALVESEFDVDARGVVGVGHRLTGVVASAVDRSDAGTLVLDATEGGDRLRCDGGRVDAIAAAVDCDVVVSTGPSDPTDVSSILVPVAGGPYSGYAVDVGLALARAHDAWLELFHVVDPDADDERRRRADGYVEAALDRLGGFEQVDTWVLEAEDVVDAIVDQSRYYDVVVMGSPRKGRLRRFVFGSTTGDVATDAPTTVVIARKTESDGSLFDPWI